MHPVLYIQSAASGVLTVNGVFCGPLEDGGQAFPAGNDAEIYIQLFPFAPGSLPVTAAMRLAGGKIERLWPQESVYALCWPDGIIQLEIIVPDAGKAAARHEETVAADTLMRYLSMRLAGDPQAELLLLRAQDAPDLSPYEAVVPLRFAPLDARERCDERAGLVRRLGHNVAAVDAALAATVPVGRGMRRIERIEIIET